MTDARQWALPASAFTAAIACRQLSDSCEGLEPDAIEVAQLLTTELVNDAMLDTDGDIHLTVVRSRVRLRVAVESRRRKPPSSLMPGRRRAGLVDRLATRWGIDSQQDDSWRVWFELPVVETESTAVSAG